MLMISTKGGAVADLRTWVRIMLSHHYDKITTLGMMDCITLDHIREEHVIVAFAAGREPHGSVLREVFVRAMLDHAGVIRSNCSEYHVAIVGEGEKERCDALADQYDWVARTAERHRVMKGAAV